MLRQFIIAESEADFTSHAGLGLIGMALERYTDVATDAAAVAPLRCDAISHRDVLYCYVATLCLGKSDFEAINSFREDEFFHEALGLKQVPSEGTLRQRMDTHADAFRTLAENAAVAFVRNVGAPVTQLDNGLVPLDCDVTRLCADGRLPRPRGLVSGTGDARGQPALPERHTGVARAGA
jgi:hypothetical protein